MKKKSELVFCDFPAEFICPITEELMNDPVIIAGEESYQAYERVEIEAWFKKSNISPLTGDNLSDDQKILLPELAKKENCCFQEKN
ncbi:MAG: hypothetical protein H0U57_05405 [Tatlockia sp.]|nr:hypothetical protein [Tatlockia sp.]